MRKLKVDTEFKSLIPPLSTDEYRQLEENLKNEGCRDALVIWDNTIIDGHNRHTICTQYGIPYATREMEFEDRQEAITWIIKNQFGRRNLPAVDRVRLALKLKDVIAEQAKRRMLAGKKNPTQEVAEGQGIETNRELGKLAGVSHETIRRYELIQKEGTDEVKKGVDAGEMSINRGFDTVRKPKAKVVVFPNLDEEVLKCTFCGQIKPKSEFFNCYNYECKACRSSRNTAGLSAAEGRRLMQKYPDEVMNRIVEEMKNPPAMQVAEGNDKNNRNPIIAELNEYLNQTLIDINKFTFMGPQNPDQDAVQLIDKLVFNLTKIKSYVKER